MKKRRIKAILSISVILLLSIAFFEDRCALSHPPNYQSIAAYKLKETYYFTYMEMVLMSEARVWPENIGEIIAFASTRNRSPKDFEVYDPITGEKVKMIYRKPERNAGDSLVFAFEKPIGVFEDVYPDYINRFPASYIAYFAKTGVKHLDALPKETHANQAR